VRGAARAAELYLHAGVRADRFGIEEVRGREILDREPERLEERDVAVDRAAWRLPDQHLADFADDVIRRDLAVLERRDDVTRFLECGLSAIDIQL
jgi:hypothetical protein